MSSEQTSFGSLLRRCRTAAGLTQEALAARAHISTRTIADLERGINRLPRHDTFELLMSALQLTVQQRTLFLALIRPEMTMTVARTSVSRLPLPPTALIGREQEMKQALTFLQHGGSRLLTLTGAPGVGKTLLGLHIARNQEGHFADGVVFVALATLRDESLLASVLAQALGLRESPEGEISEQVIGLLREKHLLLVLDNFEQIVQAASFVANLLSVCPRLSILVTSRVPLRLRAEQVLPLIPLTLADAVTLFQVRARAIRPKGVYAPQEVAAICEHLDCLPLAIELAAMHVTAFSLSDLNERLTHRLALPLSGARDLPIRQQTMEDAIAWSYELLTKIQQQYFRVLGVFMGGWTLDAVEAVCRANGERVSEETIFTLAALVDASLVQVESLPEGQRRFFMLELIRDYALERLRVAGEEEMCRRQHATYYAHLAEIAIPEGPEQESRLIQDVANVRVALQWAEERREADIGLRLAHFSWHIWFSQNQMSEAEGWLSRMLTLSWQSQEQEVASTGRRAEALYTFGQILLSRGKTGQAEATVRDALDRAQKVGDHCGICSALAILGQIAQRSGKLNEAEAFFVESDAHAKLGAYPALRGFTLRNLAEVARMQGNLAGAIILYEEAKAVTRSLGMTFGVALITTLQGLLACQQQNYALAKTHYRESLVVFHAFDSPTYIAWCLEGYATTLCAEGHYVQTTRLCASAVALREHIQAPLPPVEYEMFEQVVADARAALSEPIFEEEWALGTKFSLDQTIDYALSDACA